VDILVVEDNKQSRDALLSMFQRMGLRAHGVLSPTEALQELDIRVPRIILSDWDLNESLSGIDIASYALDRSSECVVMFYTGNCVHQLQLQTSHLRIHRYFKKPVSLQELRSECWAVFNSR